LKKKLKFDQDQKILNLSEIKEEMEEIIEKALLK